MKKRLLAFAAAVCSIGILLSGCVSPSQIQEVFSRWEQELGGGSVSSSHSQPSSVSGGFAGDALTVEELESKYSIAIKDPDRLLSDENGPENCAIVDRTLELYSKPAIDGFLKSLWRRNYDFSITFLDRDSDSLGETSYSNGHIRITIFAPRDTWNPAATNGITVETIAHELGHAFHDALEYHYGMDELRETWERLNAGYEYGGEWDAGASSVFSYEYGMTDYYEDVATVFENLAAYPSVTQARLVQTDCEPLYLKAKFLYTLMDECFDLSESSLFDAYLAANSRRGDDVDFEQSYEAFLQTAGRAA